MPIQNNRLRVAFVAGGLTQGGAEKQLVYMARALAEAGVDLRIYCLTRGDFYERELSMAGTPPIWIGGFSNPAARIVKLISLARRYQPHFIQSSHFFTNLYASIAAPLCGAISIGSIRSDPGREVQANGIWGKRLLSSPTVLLANSETARDKALTMGVAAEKVHVMPNVIDLESFDRSLAGGEQVVQEQTTTVITVARLVPVKRLDRFLRAAALAREQDPRITGMIVGDGPEMNAYRALAEELGLLPSGIVFAGRQSDIPNLLHRADIFLLTSDQEGFPNVLLEAMAAGLPVITTPAGDAGRVAQDQVTGYVVGMNDVKTLASKILELANDPEKRRRFGLAGRKRVESQYSFGQLREKLLSVYQTVAESRQHRPTLQALARISEINLHP